MTEENNELSFEPQEQITVDVVYEGRYNLSKCPALHVAVYFTIKI